MNALSDISTIRLLYRASMAGVRIRLIVRGICCLRPGVPGLSGNIEVVSIVGRFLEHSRIYYFRNGGEDEMYIGSADLMSRNIDRRVEVLFPIEEPDRIRRLREGVLETYLADDVKSRVMLSNGSYVRKKAADPKKRVNAQERLLGLRRAEVENRPARSKPHP
jgi:polyphosphate kinase